MADEPLWQDDRPPTPRELKTYLTNVLGIPAEDAARLVASYDEGEDWSPNGLAEYVDSLVTTWRQQSTREGQASDPTATTSAQRQVAAEGQEDAQRDNQFRGLQEAARGRLDEIRRGTYSSARARWVGDVGPMIDPAQSVASGYAADAAGRPVLDPETGEPRPVDANVIWEGIASNPFDMGRLGFGFVPQPSSGSISRVAPQSIRDVSIRGMEGSVEDRVGPRSPYAHRSADAYAGGAGYEAPRRGSRRVGPKSRARYLSPNQALALLSRMGEDDLTRLQQRMFDAGLYELAAEGVAVKPMSLTPDWGNADPLTRRAFMELFVRASSDPEASVDKVLADMTESRLTGPGAGGSEGEGAGLPSLEVDIPAFEPRIMSSETLGAAVDDLAQDLLGEYVPEDKKRSLIAMMQERETAVQRQAYDQQVADIRSGAQQQFGNTMTQATGGPGNDIEAFKAAISSTESGGDYTAANSVGPGHYGRYQISNRNWPSWATRAGLGPNAPKTPENQEIVATRIMLDYYAQFGNWRDVAVAWFAGPGAVGRAGSENRSDGNMTVRQYADRAVQRMGQTRGQVPNAAGGVIEIGGGAHPAIEEFDYQAQLREAIKQGDPLGFEAHEFSERAVEWFSLLGGLV